MNKTTKAHSHLFTRNVCDFFDECCKVVFCCSGESYNDITDTEADPSSVASDEDEDEDGTYSSFCLFLPLVELLHITYPDARNTSYHLRARLHEAHIFLHHGHL